MIMNGEIRMSQIPNPQNNQLQPQGQTPYQSGPQGQMPYQSQPQGQMPYQSQPVQQSFASQYSYQPGYYPPPVTKQPKKRGIGMFFLGLAIGLFIMAIVLLANSLVKRGDELEQIARKDGGLTEEEAYLLLNKVDLLVRGIDDRYYDYVETDVLLDGAYHGIVNALGDKYAAYYNQEEYASFIESSTGSYVGIGVTVSLDEEGRGAHVEDVNPSGGAYTAGIQVGDIIIGADGADFTGLTLDEIVSHIRGDEGTKVDVTFLRDDQSHTVTIERKRLATITCRSGMLEGNVGYIALSGFEGTTTSQFKEALENLKAQGMTALILDLRDNPGGRVDVVTAIADELLPEGLVMYMEDKDGNRESYYSTDDIGDFDYPLVVLVNGNSASASELLSGAIQARGAGVLVGTKTFGKGIVQTTVPFYDMSALKVTTDRYYLPDDRCIHGEGIEPDYVVELPENETLNTLRGLEQVPDISRDTQLQKAMELLGHPYSAGQEGTP